MSDLTVVLGVTTILTELMAILTMGAWIWYMRQTNRLNHLSAEPQQVRLREPDPQEAQRMRERIERAPKPTPGIEWDEVAARLAEEREAEEARRANPGMRYGHIRTGDGEPSPDMAPIPVDPERPPRPMVYRPRSGQPAPTCHCHGRTVQPGQTVLIWPVPDSEEVRVYCQREGGE